MPLYSQRQFIRAIVLLALLLPVAANATSLNKADCEFMGSYLETCGSEGYISPFVARMGVALDFDKRHPDINRRLGRICHGLYDHRAKANANISNTVRRTKTAHHSILVLNPR